MFDCLGTNFYNSVWKMKTFLAVQLSSWGHQDLGRDLGIRALSENPVIRQKMRSGVCVCVCVSSGRRRNRRKFLDTASVFFKKKKRHI